MKVKVKTQFFIKKSKPSVNGKVPIYFRIRCRSQVVEVATGRGINQREWDKLLRRSNAKTEEAAILNNFLDDIENEIRRYINYLIENGEDVNVFVLKKKLKGETENHKMLLHVFQENNELIKQELGYKYSQSTVNQYEVTYKRLKEFIRKRYLRNDMEIDKLDISFIRNFDIYLRTKYQLKANTIAKCLKQLNKVVRYAIDLRYVNMNPFAGYKITYNKTDRGYLTPAELLRLEETDLNSRRLDRVRDVFVFVCYTGLAYKDLERFNKSFIQKGIDGRNWLIFKRAKTDIEARIPILPKAQAILDKYCNDTECIIRRKMLPVLSNQRMNSYLQEIAPLCDIEKRVTMHIGRHTFATTVTLVNGVPIETVQKMLGHQDLSTTQIYARIIDEKISQDMNSLFEKMGNNHKDQSQRKIL
ncbi:MAG: site-specific integrase [Mariniphaga sp.]|nr:site-specific integrase [Mariniphaga sp.]